MELPRLETLWQKYKDQGLRIVAIEMLRDSERAKKFIAEHQLSYHLLEEAEAEEDKIYPKLFIGIGWSSTFLIGRDGKVAWVHIGFEEGDEIELEQKIREHLPA